MSVILGRTVKDKQKAASVPSKGKFSESTVDFELVDRIYVDNLEDERQANRRYFTVAIVMAAVALLSVVGLLFMFFSGRYQYVIIPVNDKTGVVGTPVLAGVQSAAVPPKAVDGMALEWITDLRAVGPDAIVLKRYSAFVYTHTATTATAFVDDYFKAPATNPFARGRQGITVDVVVSRIDTVQDQTVVTFTEITRDATGAELHRERHAATLTIRRGSAAPADLNGALLNPFNLYVTSAKWSDPIG